METEEMEHSEKGLLNLWQTGMLGYYKGVAACVFKSIHVHMCRRPSMFLYPRVVTTPP